MGISISYNVLWGSKSSSIRANGIIQIFRFDIETSLLNNPLLRNPYHCLFYNAIDGEEWEEDCDYIIDRNDPRWQRMVDHRFEFFNDGVRLDRFPWVLNLGKYSGYLDIYKAYDFYDECELKEILKKIEFYYNEYNELIIKTPNTKSGLKIRFFNEETFKKKFEPSIRYSEYGWQNASVYKSKFLPDV